MEAHAHLDPVELLVLYAQVRIRNVRPSAAYVNRPPFCFKYLDSATAPGGKVEVRSISSGKIAVCPHAASGKFDVGCDARRAQAGIPTQDNRLKSSPVKRLRLNLAKHRNQTESIFETSAPPTASDLSGQNLAYKNSRR